MLIRGIKNNPLSIRIGLDTSKGKGVNQYKRRLLIMSNVESLSSEEIRQTHEIIRWAEHLANKYEIGLNTIINNFVERRSTLGTKEAAMESVEQELSLIRRR